MADVTIKCTHCQQELSLDEQYLGMEVECPTCGNSFVAQKTPVIPKLALKMPAATQASAVDNTVENLKASTKLFADALATTGKNFVNKVATQNSPSELQTSNPEIEYARKQVRKYFQKIQTQNLMGGIASQLSESLEVVFFIFVIFRNLFNKSNEIFSYFFRVQEHDMNYLEQLNILPRYGKSDSQLVSDVCTLYSPIIDAEEEDNIDVKFQFYDNKAGGKYLLYSMEEVTKLFTFENQLFVYNAVWDYTRGAICAEQTEAFFLKDITDISTKTAYKSLIKKMPPTPAAIFIFVVCILFLVLILSVIAGSTCGADAFFVVLVLASLIGAMFVAIFKKFCGEKVERIYRSSETFTITSSSGRCISATIVCNEWMEANNATYAQRSDGEKTIHAIRKMIEEKKVALNE